MPKQHRAEGYASQRGRGARPEGPHRAHACSRDGDELSIILRPRRTTGVLSEKGRAAARTATQGGWPGGRRTAPQPGPSCLTFTQRSDNCSPPAHAESTLPAGHPPSWAVRQQSSTLAAFSAAPCAGCQASGSALAFAFFAPSLAPSWAPAEGVPHPASKAAAEGRPSRLPAQPAPIAPLAAFP